MELKKVKKNLKKIKKQTVMGEIRDLRHVRKTKTEGKTITEN